jgi:hypothetical protein
MGRLRQQIWKSVCVIAAREIWIQNRMMSPSSDELGQCVYELTLWRVRVIFVPSRLCSHLDPTSFQESACMVIYCRRQQQQQQQQHMLRYSREMPDFNQIWVCWQIVIIVQNIKFHPKQSSECRADTCGQTDRWTGGRFSRHRERAYKK